MRSPLKRFFTSATHGCWMLFVGVGSCVGLALFLSLTADIRYVFLNYDFKEIPGSGDLNSNFTVATVGLL